MRKPIRLTVYPFSASFLPFCLAESEQIQIVRLVSPIGYNLENKDAGSADRRDSIGMIVNSDFDEALSVCDAVLFPGGDYTELFLRDIFDKIISTAKAGKDIYTGVDFDEQQTSAIMDICKSSGAAFVHIKKQVTEEKLYYQKPDRMYVPKAPVVFVGELIERANSEDITIALTTFFKRRGYRVSTIVCSKEARVFGFHTHDEYQSKDFYPEHQTIDMLNSWIKEIEENEVPDLFVIQLPGGMMRLDDIETSKHGIYAYMWSQVLTPDYFLLCAPYGLLDPNEIQYVNDVFRYRYGFTVDGLHISNSSLDFENHYTYFRSIWGYQELAKVYEIINQTIDKESVPLYCALKNSDMERLCQDVERALSQGDSIEVL